jgi:hypothetical protein
LASSTVPVPAGGADGEGEGDAGALGDVDGITPPFLASRRIACVRNIRYAGSYCGLDVSGSP